MGDYSPDELDATWKRLAEIDEEIAALEAWHEQAVTMYEEMLAALRKKAAAHLDNES